MQVTETALRRALRDLIKEQTAVVKIPLDHASVRLMIEHYEAVDEENERLRDALAEKLGPDPNANTSPAEG